MRKSDVAGAGTARARLRTPARAQYSGPRRSQADRSTETRAALLEGAVKVIHKVGYGGASTALIADEAGTSRGSIIHHFGTRAELMAEVVRSVYEAEREQYTRRMTALGRPVGPADWIDFCWEVLSQPASMAVLEILQASRSDPELAAQVGPMQAEIERQALNTVTGGDPKNAEAILDEMRLIVWAIRGMSLAQVILPEPGDIKRAVDVFKKIMQAGVSAGVLPPSRPQAKA